MNEKEIEALVSLLDDDDREVAHHVESKIYALGGKIIPFLESQWEKSFNPDFQKRIEDIIHQLQFDALKRKLINWRAHQSADLLKGMCLVATYQYPDLDYSKIKRDFEQLYHEAWVGFEGVEHPYDQVKKLNNFIFTRNKFSSNTKNFHAPANSMINMVLETRKGNPISLCVVYMLIAQKLKLPIYGVNLPNLFILTYKKDKTQFYINAFNKGLIFSKNDIDNYIQHLHIPTKKMFYEPCSNIDVVKRVLRNLVISFEKLSEHARADEIKTLLQAISEPGEDQFPDE